MLEDILAPNTEDGIGTDNMTAILINFKKWKIKTLWPNDQLKYYHKVIINTTKCYTIFYDALNNKLASTEMQKVLMVQICPHFNEFLSIEAYG